MDKDRLKTDISYKEGYVEGRKETIYAIITHLQDMVNYLRREYKYDELLLENISKPKKEE